MALGAIYVQYQNSIGNWIGRAWLDGNAITSVIPDTLYSFTGELSLVEGTHLYRVTPYDQNGFGDPSPPIWLTYTP
jgi:hypothetical protein